MVPPGLSAGTPGPHDVPVSPGHWGCDPGLGSLGAWTPLGPGTLRGQLDSLSGGETRTAKMMVIQRVENMSSIMPE